MGNEKNNGDVGIFRQQGVIQDCSGNVLGYVSENGFLYDRRHDLLGYVSQQGIVRGVSLRMVGHVNIQQHRFPYDAGRAAFLLFEKAKEV